MTHIVNSRNGKVIIDIDKIAKEYNSGLSKKQLSIRYSISTDSIDKIFKTYNIKTNRRRSLSNKDIVMSELDLEIVDGIMLGDGCICMNGKSKNANISYTSKYLEHTNYIYNLLNKFSIHNNINKDIKYFSVIDKRTNKEYESYRFRSKSLPSITIQFNRWYRKDLQRGKILPKDIRITPLTCLLWYIGDGSLLKGKNYSQTIQLSTDSFDKESLEKYVLPNLHRFSPFLRKSGIKNQYRIMIPRKCIKDFLSYIGDCPLDCYKHKWDYSEYKNSEPRSFKHLKDKFIYDYENGCSIKDISKKYNVECSLIRYYINRS